MAHAQCDACWKHSDAAQVVQLRGRALRYLCGTCFDTWLRSAEYPRESYDDFVRRRQAELINGRKGQAR